jgi:hypothetical protein
LAKDDLVVEPVISELAADARCRLDGDEAGFLALSLRS